MIALDTSSVVAIALGEPEADRFVSMIQADRQTRLSAPNYLEASNVLEGRFGPIGRSLFESIVADLADRGMVVVALDRAMAELARDGFRRYGKGRHSAGLNFGDCFAYALAKALDAPLLFKGEDFAKTDVKCA